MAGDGEYVDYEDRCRQLAYLVTQMEMFIGSPMNYPPGDREAVEAICEELDRMHDEGWLT